MVTAIHATDPPADPRVSRTHAAVLSAGIDLLAERGYPGFSIAAIVERTGVAKTTIYRHWPSRAELLSAVIMQLDGDTPLPDTGSARTDLLTFFAGRVQAAQTRQWQRCMPALVAAAALDPALAKIIATLTGRYLGQVKALLARGRDRGELRPELSLELAASALVGTFAFRQLLLHEAPTAAQVETLLDMLMRGISADGHRPSTQRTP